MNPGRVLLLLLSFTLSTSTILAKNIEYLVKLKNVERDSILETLEKVDGSFSLVSAPGKLFKLSTETRTAYNILKNHPNVEYIQNNHPIKLFSNPSIERNRERFEVALRSGGVPDFSSPGPDNPDIQSPPSQSNGADPLLNKSWGLANINVNAAWNNTPQGKGIIVAVTDTGVDYNHEDLISNMWRNPGETPGDNIDNDGNGFVDDIVGWDFATDDNKPFDHTLSLMEVLLQGGNPGHGTHCAGVVGANSENQKGSAGVAPKVTLMALRFITERGQGTTEAAIKVVDYAVANGAHIISASWGSEGEEMGDKALRDAVIRAEKAGVLFIAAAGNGRANAATGGAAGFDNDTDSKPVYPASYEYDNVITVAAMDSADKIAAFSNWGKKSVDLGAPGVKVFSTVPGNRYQDTIIDMGDFLKATWDGTSMATPHVAGALANLWSADPSASMADVKSLLLQKTQAVAALKGKVSTDGKLDLTFLANN